MKKSIILLCFLTATFLCTNPAFAVPFTFENISNNSGIAADLLDQLILDVDLDNDPVRRSESANILFRFRNLDHTNSIGSFISSVYFDDDLGFLNNLVANIHNEGRVRFSERTRRPNRGGGPPGSGPPNLPGGNSLDPAFQSDLSANRVGGAFNGVNVGESLGIQFDGGREIFDDVIAALYSGDLRVGLHIGGIEGSIDRREDSDSFVISRASVPEPATMLLLGIGLLGLAGYSRRRIRN